MDNMGFILAKVLLHSLLFAKKKRATKNSENVQAMLSYGIKSNITTWNELYKLKEAAIFAEKYSKAYGAGPLFSKLGLAGSYFIVKNILQKKVTAEELFAKETKFALSTFNNVFAIKWVI